LEVAGSGGALDGTSHRKPIRFDSKQRSHARNSISLRTSCNQPFVKHSLFLTQNVKFFLNFPQASDPVRLDSLDFQCLDAWPSAEGARRAFARRAAVGLAEKVWVGLMREIRPGLPAMKWRRATAGLIKAF